MKPFKVWVAVDKDGLVEGGCTKEELDERLGYDGFCVPEWGEDGVCTQAGLCGPGSGGLCHRHSAEIILTGKAQ